MSKKAITVIGGGMAGISAALALSSQGHAVTLIEQHEQLGGKLREATFGDKRIDCGPTVFTLKPVFDRLFSMVNERLEDHVNLKQAHILARHFWLDQSPFDLYSDVSKTCEQVDAVFNAKEAERYRKFASQTKAVFDTLDDTFMQAQKPTPLSLTFSHGLTGIFRLWQTQPFKTLWASLAKDFESPHLRQLFARYATYCGSSPFQAPATLMLIAHAERQGVWYLEEGMYSLVQALQNLLEKQEVHILLSTKVTDIATQSDGSVKSVTIDNNQARLADAIVFAGDTADLTAGSFGTKPQQAVSPRTDKSLSAITRSELATTSGLQLSHHNVFFSNDYPLEFEELFELQRVPSHPTLYVCAQDRGDAKELNGPERLFTLANAPAAQLDEEVIERTVSSIPNWLNQYGLQTTPHTESKSDSPNTFGQLFPSTQGALYGRPTHGMMGSFQRPGSRSKLKGLYLAGASVHPGAGIPMVCLSGMLAAEAVQEDG